MKSLQNQVQIVLLILCLLPVLIVDGGTTKYDTTVDQKLPNSGLGSDQKGRNFDLANPLNSARYFGESGEDVATDIETTKDGNLLISGLTSSTDFPTTLGAQHEDFIQDEIVKYNVFLMKVTPQGYYLEYVC